MRWSVREVLPQFGKVVNYSGHVGSGRNAPTTLGAFELRRILPWPFAETAVSEWLTFDIMLVYKFLVQSNLIPDKCLTLSSRMTGSLIQMFGCCHKFRTFVPPRNNRFPFLFWGVFGCMASSCCDRLLFQCTSTSKVL